MPLNVLFVCTGNTCRSPMAEGLLRSQLPVSRRDAFIVSSAGTAASKGEPVSAMAVEALREIGVDISDHTARPLTEAMVKTADLILTLTAAHLEQTLHRFPAAEGKAFLLSRYAERSGPAPDIADPVGENLPVYRETRDRIRAYTKTIAEKMSA